MTRSSVAQVLGHAEQAEHGPALTTQEVPPFETIYDQYFDFVWASTKRLGVASSVVDDVVQEIFMVIHSRIRTLRQPQSLRSWIYGIVRRTVSDHHRSRRTREASGAAFAVQTELELPATPTPSDLAEQSDQAKLLFSLLAELDAPKREVFMLAELEEMTVPEIAEALEIPLNTAYSRLRAARLLFEEKVQRRVLRAPGGPGCRT